MEGTEASPKNTDATFFKTCFNGLNAIAGIGIISVPYALAEGGWLSLLLLLLIATVCYYTGLLLRRCMDSNILVKTYPDIGELAFGNKGRLTVATFLYLELYLVAIGFLIMEGDNLEKLFPAVDFKLFGLEISGRQAFVLLATAIVLPTTWLRNLDMLAYVSIGGVLSSLILVGCVIYVGIEDHKVRFREKRSNTVPLRWKGIPMAVSLYVFCFSGHAVFPTIYTSMKDKTKFSKVLLLCFALCILNYSVMAIFGYLMYGSEVKSQITLNLPTRRFSTKLAIFTTLINPITKYALLITPICSALEEYWISTSLSSSSSKFKYVSVVIRTSLVVSTMIAALTLPFFGYLMALTGSFLSTSASILLPCVCYLKVFKEARRCGVESFVIVVIVVTGMLIGTYTSMKQIVNNL